MKYYLYISDTKVNMIYPQIPRSFLKSVSGELKINLGVFSASLKPELSDPGSDRIKKTAIVANYIRSSDQVGSVDAPGEYIHGVAPLYGVRVQYLRSEMAFFGGIFDGVPFGLIGSAECLIGAVQTADAKHDFFGYGMDCVRDSAETVRTGKIPRGTLFEYMQAIEISLGLIRGDAKPMEFLARVLSCENDCIVASPIYVALANDNDLTLRSTVDDDTLVSAIRERLVHTTKRQRETRYFVPEALLPSARSNSKSRKTNS